MTREEAIRILRKDIECMSHTSCEDCILEKVCDPMITPSDTQYIEVFEMAIQALEPKTGHWIDHHSPEAKKCMQYMSECSVCGKMICNRYNIYRNFCPNCGAKMEEE